MCLQCPTVGPSSYGLAMQKCRNHILSSDIESMVSGFEQAGENKVEKTPEEIRKRRKLALAIRLLVSNSSLQLSNAKELGTW